ncbi:MAG TPA: ROK family protein [Candidatus Anaerobiospirillum stercoravium]|nr:ROK family protein [Candidatus Anaerobiospirillum stercoravium]
MEDLNQLMMSHDIREKNLERVLRTLHKEQVATATRLNKLTGLSVVTINKLLSQLVDSGQVTIGAHTKNLKGRPATTYHYNAAYKLILVISCYKRSGHDYAGYSIHDLFGECIERREELLQMVHTDEFKVAIENYLERYPKISMIGISMPSDSIGGRMASALRRDPLSRRLAQHMKNRYHLPVFFETDINAATLGAFKRHAHYEFVCGLALVPGRSPVCSFCYNGSLIRGRDGLAGEVKHFPMYNNIGILPLDPEAADDLAVRTLQAVTCVLNPALIIVYAESLKHGPALSDRLKRRLSNEAEIVLMPKIEVTDKIREDIVSGMITLCLQRLNQPNLNA